MSITPKPFKIQATPDQLSVLKQKLALATYPDTTLPNDDWAYGIPTHVVKDLVDYWGKDYDWNKQEAELNTHPHFKALVNDIDLHFIHVPSSSPDAIPLLLIHGWPGSYFEFHKLIPHLSEFHVVVPSLPGYGFSSAPKIRGFGITHMAKTLDMLMKGLGYNKYIAQGGDWGSIIARGLAAAHSDSCRGIHINMVALAPPPPEQAAKDMAEFTEQEKKWIAETTYFNDQEVGYQRIQQTKPQTLGHGLSDSPVGLMAWIVEKFHSWTDLRGEKDLPPTITKDQLLTNVMIYYITNTITPSTRLYYEAINKGDGIQLLASPSPAEVPVGIAVFPKEIYKFPRKWCQASFPGLCSFEVFPTGGHFAALEEGEALLGEIKKFAGLEAVKKALAA